MPRKLPTARAGNYTAPVDTAGMDPEMKATLEVNKPKAKPGLGAALKNLFKNNTKKKGY